MESLFARPVPKRCRLCVMFGMSLLLHGGIIGIAGMWTPPEPEENSVVFDWGVADSGSDVAPQPTQADDPLPPTPAPPVIEDAVPTPPDVPDDAVFYVPAQTPVPRRPVVSKSPAVPRSSHALATAGTGPVSTTSNAANGPGVLPGTGSMANANAWVMPHPPYPAYMLMKRGPVSATTVRIVTDAGGQVSSVVVVKSTGNPSLDHYTEEYVRSHWRGPVNASRNTEFVYQTR